MQDPRFFNPWLNRLSIPASFRLENHHKRVLRGGKRFEIATLSNYFYKWSMRLEDMRLLLRVAETGSMSLAARQMRLTPAAVSASLRRLERELGTRIFERSTRSLRATDEGMVILDGCRAVTQRWQQTLEDIQGEGDELRGSVRVSAPGDTAYQIMAPAIIELASRYPELQIVLHCADTLHHLQRDAIDMAIRYGKMQDSSLTARKVSERPGLLVASPTYLSKHPELKEPSDLHEHQTITLQLGERMLDTWTLVHKQDTQRVKLHRPLCADGHLARQWALEGRGIAFKSLFDIIEDLERGTLIQVLPQYFTPKIPIHTVFPSNKHVPVRVRAVEETLRQRFRERDARCDAWLQARA